MFLKYPSIENHYQEKWISRFLDRFGNEIIDTQYVIQEKIHGANLQLIFEPGGEMQIASRNQITDRDFYGVGEVLNNIDLIPFVEFANNNNAIINLYGELFGANIQKGVDYGDQKRILFFDMKINGELLTQLELENFFSDFELERLLVPVLYYKLGLESALSVNTKVNSKLSNKEDNECEGVVIKPYVKRFYSSVGSLFYIKKKNEKFKEKYSRKVRKPSPEWGETVNELRDTFLAYLNEERLESVFSKFGRIDDRKDIGKYIGYMMKDATDTFKKEENLDSIIEENNLTKEEVKYILSSDKKISEWIMNEST